MKLRGHHLLCVLGFKGMGYSQSFIDNMAEVVAQLRDSHDPSIEIVDGPDDICLAAPGRVGDSCGHSGRLDSEARVRDHDLRVLKWLGVASGTLVEWSRVKKMVAERMKPSDLALTCPSCPWRPLGVCAEGIEAVRNDI
ncbi:MAG: DUF1284 domain-containing protein [Dehalococcoidia bacterium]|nr:DUF1284 domain-containing protein [Dehalococcoidia bacterium]